MTNRSQFDPGEAVWNQRQVVRAALPRLQSFLDVILCQGPRVMLPEDYSKVFATVLEFKPDLIIEVGRLFGNTTCMLTEAAQSLPNASVLSLCLTDHWNRRTLPAIKPLISAGWLEKLDARVMNLLTLDVEKTLEGKNRVMFVLDAHGWQVGEFMLGVVLPRLVRKDHVLFIHDVISPTHYAEVYEKYWPDAPSRPTDGMEGYGKKGIWKGTDDTWDRFVFMNGLAGMYPEFVAFADFVNRNHLTLHSLEASVRRAIDDHPDRRAEMRALLGETMYSPASGFAWFRLEASRDPSTVRFPTYEPRWNESAGILSSLRDDLRRNTIAGRPSALTLSRIMAKAALGRYTVR
ncbi:MAG TPA: hypothetical protein VFG76_06680 [Candidatus Polarisedimenticolia bacterium]|nr:hypothetical protein [Candidatus Polarisedimenticolia bacterium]